MERSVDRCPDKRGCTVDIYLRDIHVTEIYYIHGCNSCDTWY